MGFLYYFVLDFEWIKPRKNPVKYMMLYDLKLSYVFQNLRITEYIANQKKMSHFKVSIF